MKDLELMAKEAADLKNEIEYLRKQNDIQREMILHHEPRWRDEKLKTLREAAGKLREDFKSYYAECFKDEAEEAIKEFDKVMGEEK